MPLYLLFQNHDQEFQALTWFFQANIHYKSMIFLFKTEALPWSEFQFWLSSFLLLFKELLIFGYPSFLFLFFVEAIQYIWVLFPKFLKILFFKLTWTKSNTQCIILTFLEIHVSLNLQGYILHQSKFNQGRRTSRRHILRNALQEICLHDGENWLGKSKIRKSSLEFLILSSSCCPQIDFLLLQGSSDLLFRQVNWMKEVHPEYLGKSVSLKFNQLWTLTTKYFTARPWFAWLNNWIIG